MKKSWCRALLAIICIVVWWVAAWGGMVILERMNSPWRHAYLDSVLWLTITGFIVAVVILNIKARRNK
jgi:hypothetical protein